MSKLYSVWTLATLALALSSAGAQDNSTQTSGSAAAGGGQQQQPVPAYGQENAPAPISENPPITGLDLPGLEPHAAPLSYLQLGATVSESADSNVGNALSGHSFSSIGRALGSVTLQRLWSHYDLALDYVGGAGYYDATGYGLKSLQELDFDQKITWKRGQLSLRDSFSYLPEGNFGGAYGALGSGISSLGGTSFGAFWGGSALGTLGQAPRVLNVSLADITENLSPKSAVTVAGGYAFTHFYGNDTVTNGSFINSSQTSFLVGYDRLLTSKTQVAVVYGYQAFDFSVIGTAVHAHVFQLMYGHRVSGRMDFVAGAGPQFLRISFACSAIDVLLGNPHCSLDQNMQPVGSIPDTRLGVAGRAQLRYRFPKTALDLAYQRSLTNGSGFFAGAQSDVARLGMSRPLTRVWTGFVDLGYSRNSRLQPVTGQGVNAAISKSGFAGLGAHRSLGRTFQAYGSYQFNQLWLDQSYCQSATPCSRIGNRHVITLGLDWTPRPIRID